MLNRDSLFDAMSGISDDYLASASDLLGDLEEVNFLYFGFSRTRAEAL